MGLPLDVFFSEILKISFCQLSRILGANTVKQCVQHLHTVKESHVRVFQYVFTRSSELPCCTTTFTQASAIKKITLHSFASWNKGKLTHVVRGKKPHQPASTIFRGPVCLFIIHCFNSLLMLKYFNSIITTRSCPLVIVFMKTFS